MTMNFVYLERWQIYDYDLRLLGQIYDHYSLFIQFYSRDSQYHKMKYFPMMINIIYQFCFQDSENYLRVYNLIWPLFHKLEVNANWVNRWMNPENQTKFVFFLNKSHDMKISLFGVSVWIYDDFHSSLGINHFNIFWWLHL
jgi:hypothetical protein